MTHINGEPVELVTSFESLRCMDIVYVAPCRWCLRPHHRYSLLRFKSAEKGYSRHPGNVLVREARWMAEPPPPCFAPDDPSPGVSVSAVQAGRVYRVINPLEAPAESTHERRPEVVR